MPSNFARGFSFGAGFCTTIVLLCLVILSGLFFCPNTNKLARSVYIAITTPATDTLREAYDNRDGQSREDIFSYTLSYYDTIISFLVALLGLTALFGYVYIRGISTDKAEESMEKSVDRYFDSDKYRQRIGREIDRAVKENIDVDFFEGSKSKITILEEKIADLDDKIKSEENEEVGPD